MIVSSKFLNCLILVVIPEMRRPTYHPEAIANESIYASYTGLTLDMTLDT